MIVQRDPPRRARSPAAKPGTDARSTSCGFRGSADSGSGSDRCTRRSCGHPASIVAKAPRLHSYRCLDSSSGQTAISTARGTTRESVPNSRTPILRPGPRARWGLKRQAPATPCRTCQSRYVERNWSCRFSHGHHSSDCYTSTRALVAKPASRLRRLLAPAKWQIIYKDHPRIGKPAMAANSSRARANDPDRSRLNAVATKMFFQLAAEWGFESPATDHASGQPERTDLLPLAIRSRCSSPPRHPGANQRSDRHKGRDPCAPPPFPTEPMPG